MRVLLRKVFSRAVSSVSAASISEARRLGGRARPGDGAELVNGVGKRFVIATLRYDGGGVVSMVHC